MPGPIRQLAAERTADPGRQRRQAEPPDVRDAAEVAPLEGEDADREQDEVDGGQGRDGRPVR